jgi:hypothetical protein
VNKVNQFYSGKHKAYVVKYEVACHPTTLSIVWVNGPVPGAVHDLTLARSAFLSQLKEGEKVFADKGYIGEPQFITPIVGDPEKLTPGEMLWNCWHSSQHFTQIERLNGRLHVWQALSTKWRHDVTLHKLAFLAVANVDLLHPL